MSIKHEVSILAIFKNEESFLPSWLDHYFNRNIDHIYLLNDNSSDNSIDIINQHKNKNNITLLHTNIKDQQYKNLGRQAHLYNKYYYYLLKETKWIGIFDLDEFCYSPQEIDFKKILKEYEYIENIEQLIIDWYWFGSNNIEDQPKDIIGSFTKRASQLSKVISNNNNIIKQTYSPNWCCKSFAKTKNIKQLCHHFNIFSIVPDPLRHHSLFPFLSINYNVSNKNIMFINHYIGSKKYYFNNKVSRGSCNMSKYIQKNKAMIYEYINLNEVEDMRLANQKC